MPFAAAWMDPDIFILSELSQTETEKEDVMWHPLYVESKNKQYK